jgi:hypothetical protein
LYFALNYTGVSAWARISFVISAARGCPTRERPASPFPARSNDPSERPAGVFSAISFARAATTQRTRRCARKFLQFL